jgi:DMSO/TMAO reductase YedYZ molybdopterin-dependent catalytic subunit
MTFSRRALLATGSAGLLAGCDRLSNSAAFRGLLGSAEGANFVIQRSLPSRMALAREFAPEDRSPIFRANGTRRPEGADYDKHEEEGFANWQLRVDGLIHRPQSLSLATLRAMPQRSQITRHDCVEGWSAIGQWRGSPLACKQVPAISSSTAPIR